MYELLILFGVFCVVCVFFLAIYSYNTRVRVRNAINRMENDNKRSLSLRKMAEVEASLSELTDAYDALLTSHKKLRSRIGMRHHRERKNEVPDPQQDPAGYKRAMRLKLNARNL